MLYFAFRRISVPSRLACPCARMLSSTSRTTVAEHLKFASRTVCQRTAENQRQSVAMKDNPFVCCSFVRADGLAAVTITDQECKCGHHFV